MHFLDVQKDNVANQREHLILLLANVHIRQFPKPDQQSKVLFVFYLIFTISLNHCGSSFSHGDELVVLCVKLDERALNDVMKKLFKNYKKWCKYLGRKSSLWWGLWGFTHHDICYVFFFAFLIFCLSICHRLVLNTHSFFDLTFLKCAFQI